MTSDEFSDIEQLDENLRKWFKEKWVRFGPDGKIRGACARGDDSEGKPKCLPQKKAQNLGKKGRKYAASKKRREDPNPERTGKAKNVATKKKTNEDIPFNECPSCRGPIVHESMMNEKQDACYHKVKSRYKVWPSAYASGALVQCRKKGASNWGTGGKKKNESSIMKGIVGEAAGTPGGLEMYRTKDMVDLAMQQNLYKKDLEALKKAQQADKPSPSRSTPSVAGQDLTVHLGSNAYPTEVVRDWIANRDIGSATEFMSRRNTSRQSKEFKAELIKDPRFAEAVANFFDVAAKTLQFRDKMRSNPRISYKDKEEGLRLDGFDATRKINAVVTDYLKKFGVDKTGRRVPPTYNYDLGEAKAKPYVKPFMQDGKQVGWKSSDGYHVKYWQMFAKDSAIKHAKLNPDEVQEDYTGEFAAEKTPAINPYGGLKDRQHRGAISETPTDNPTGASGEGGWRKYKPKPAGEIEEDTAYAGGMGQGGNAGESYRKFTPKSAGTFNEDELDEACWKGYHKEGNKKMFGKTYPNCVKNTNEEKRLDKNKISEYNVDDMLEKVQDCLIQSRGQPKRTLLTKLYNIVYHLKRDHDGNTISREELKLTPWLGKHGLALLDAIMDNTSKEEQLDEKCWDTHKQVGMKNKGGRQVPNCVPKESAIMKGINRLI